MIEAIGLHFFAQFFQDGRSVLQKKISRADLPFLKILIWIEQCGKLVCMVLGVGILAQFRPGCFIAQ